MINLNNMTLLLIIELVLSIIVYHYLKKKLIKKYHNEFVKKIKWMLIEPVLQVIFLGSTILDSSLIIKTYIYLFMNMSSSLTLSSNLYEVDAAMKIDHINEMIRNSSSFDTLALSAIFSSIIGAIGLIIFIIMIIRQVKGLFTGNTIPKIKKYHDITLITYVIVTLCSFVFYFNMARCVEETGYYYVYTDYTDLFVLIGLFIVIITTFLIFFRKKFIKAINVYYQYKEQELKQNTEKANDTNNSKARQLLELKELLDKGLLTQEEFDNEKKKILNS